MENFKCDDCGDLEYVLIDGYGFGDRQLEGVSFVVSIEDGEKKVVVCKDDKDYCKTLNMKHWLEEAHKYVNEEDFAECPKCGGDVDLDDPYDGSPPKTSPGHVSKLK